MNNTLYLYDIMLPITDVCIPINDSLPHSSMYYIYDAVYKPTQIPRIIYSFDMYDAVYHPRKTLQIINYEIYEIMSHKLVKQRLLYVIGPDDMNMSREERLFAAFVLAVIGCSYYGLEYFYTQYIGPIFFFFL